MVTHVVIFSWREGAAPEDVARLRDGLDRLASDLTDLGTIRHGADLRFRHGNGDYALVATFADRAGWDAYQADPRHKALVRDLVAPIQASRLTIQF
ncbi:Dabb family protein [uncultured Sphingomonas sp.]|uniref:Dabb family protein n=1 Tax=uncultured Sphingomonas sp. TaxID=158754 RepID=UPI0035CAA796